MSVSYSARLLGIQSTSALQAVRMQPCSSVPWLRHCCTHQMQRSPSAPPAENKPPLGWSQAAFWFRTLCDRKLQDVLRKIWRQSLRTDWRWTPMYHEITGDFITSRKGADKGRLWREVWYPVQNSPRKRDSAG